MEGAVSDFIPTKKVKEKNSPLWITGEIIHILRKKEAARLKLRKSTGSEQQYQKYRELRKKAKDLIRESRDNYFSSLDSDLARQPKRFWTFFSLNNKMHSFPEPMSNGHNEQRKASTPQRIAELFNSYFTWQ